MENKLRDISIKHIQIFLKAVELRNFTKTAEFFNFTPSMVSKTIAFLERELELKLFVRRPHELYPTDAALMLFDEWRQLAGAFERSISNAQAHTNSIKKRLAFGFVDSSISVDRLIIKFVTDYRRQASDTELVIEKHDMHRLAELLNNGMLDLIQTSEFEIPYLDEHELCWERIFYSHAAIYIPRANALFDKKYVSFDDLKHQTFISLNNRTHPFYIKWLTGLCREHGFVPEIAEAFNTVRSLLFSLKMGSSVFVGDTITSDWSDDDLKCFVQPERSFSLLAWRGSADSSTLELKEYFKNKYSRYRFDGPDIRT